MTSIKEETSGYAMEMDLVGFIQMDLLDDLLARIDLAPESKAQLQEWRYLSEKAYNEGHFEYALALAQALKCTAIYAHQSQAAFPLARAKIRNKERRVEALNKVRAERHRASKGWHATALKYHNQGRSGAWISERLGPDGPSKSAVNRFLKNNGASQVPESADC